MSGRIVKRMARRLQVQYRRQGESTSHPGYTRNISASGMFIGTNAPLRPGTPLEIDVHDEGGDFHLIAEVVHAARVPPLLQKLRTSGMGVRFLQSHRRIPELLSASGMAWEDIKKGLQTLKERGASLGEVEIPVADEPTEPGLYRVLFDSPADLHTAIRHDLQHGEMFVATSRPAELDEEISIELGLAGSEQRALIPARVVRVQDGTTGECGLDVALLDTSGALQQARAILAPPAGDDDDDEAAP